MNPQQTSIGQAPTGIRPSIRNFVNNMFGGAFAPKQQPEIPGYQIIYNPDGTVKSQTGQVPGAPAPAQSSGFSNPFALPVANAQTASAASAPGSPQLASMQQQSDLAKYFPNLVPNASSITPQPFSINPGPTISSSSANPSYSTNDALTAAAQNRAALFNGSAPSSMVPSDNLLSSVVGQIYNASQYSPGEQNALQQYSQTQGQILQTQLAARRQIQQLQQDGSLTAAQAASFTQEAQRRSDADLADLATQQSGNTLSLQTLGMLRQNQLGALQNVAQFLQPMQVPPGSTLYNPITGVQYQGAGASPAQIAQQASTFITQDQSTGNLQLNPDGTINQQYYQNKAQSYYGGNASYGQQQGMQTGAQAPAGSSNGQAQVPQSVSQYVTNDSTNGIQYINANKVPTNQQNFIQQQAAQYGIPYLTSDDITKFQNISVTQQNLNQLSNVIPQILSSGIAGRIQGLTVNQIENLTETNPLISSFANYRDTALNTIQALAGGSGSGFRLNQAEIDVATSNLPEITDNSETAQAKLAVLNSFLSKWSNELLTGNPADTSGTTLPGNSSSSAASNNPFSDANFYGN